MAHIRAARRGSRVSTAIHSPARTLTATSPFASRARAHTDYRVGADDARAAVSGKFWKFGKRSEVGSTSLALSSHVGALAARLLFAAATWPHTRTRWLVPHNHPRRLVVVRRAQLLQQNADVATENLAQRDELEGLHAEVLSQRSALKEEVDRYEGVEGRGAANAPQLLTAVALRGRSSRAPSSLTVPSS